MKGISHCKGESIMSNIDKLQQKYNYKIVYKLKSNLEEPKKKFIEKKIEACISKFNLEKHSDGAIYKKAGFKGNEDFGGVTFTYSLLKEDVNCFEKLEWHDMYADLVKRAC